MIAKELIADDIPTLKPESTIEEAKAVFTDYFLCHIPIVKEEQYIGVFPYDMVNAQDADNADLKSFKDDFIHSFVDANQHIINIFEIANEYELSVIPVTGDQNKYEGAIGITQLMSYFGGVYSFKEVGGILTLTVPFKNYDLSEISRIVESNNSKILSLFTEAEENSAKVQLTIKVNTIDLLNLQASFERFGYDIHIHHAYDQRETDMKERYDLLMKYLNT